MDPNIFCQQDRLSAGDASAVQQMGRSKAGCCDQVQLCCGEPRNPEHRVIPAKPACCFLKGPDRKELPVSCPVASSRYRPKKKNNTARLGFPVGIVQSSFTIDARELSSSQGALQRFATCMKAFAKTFLLPVTEWHTNIIDQVIFEGHVLYTESAGGDKGNGDQTKNALIVPVQQESRDESRIKREFNMDGCTFKIALGSEFECFQNRELMVVASLRPALKAFFRDAAHCLFYVARMYYMIWKTKDVFVVFDFYGRSLNDLQSSHENGWAVMICLRSIDNVVHLLGQLSGLDSKEPISLRELKMVRLARPNEPTQTRDPDGRRNEFEIVDSDYAFLKAKLHLSLNPNDPKRNRSALPVAIATLIASKIDHPATWNSKMLDKLICFGHNLCRETWKHWLSTRHPIDLRNSPKYVKIGQFVAYFSLVVYRRIGIWRCVPNFKQNELTKAIAQSFKDGKNMLMLQIGQQIYAIWTKHSYIYMMDPYRHRLADDKSASLRMFGSMETFFKVLTDLLLESNRSTKFSIHSLHIKKIETGKVPEPGMSAVYEDLCDDDADIKSLNENICFEDDTVKCYDMLEEVSDFEDKDSSTTIVRVEQRPTSASEASEEGMEEEEGGEQFLGEIDDNNYRGRKHKKGVRGSRKKGGKGVGGKGKRGHYKGRWRGRSNGPTDKRKRRKGTKSKKTKRTLKSTKKSEKMNVKVDKKVARKQLKKKTKKKAQKEPTKELRNVANERPNKDPTRELTKKEQKKTDTDKRTEENKNKTERKGEPMEVETKIGEQKIFDPKMGEPKEAQPKKHTDSKNIDPKMEERNKDESKQGREPQIDVTKKPADDPKNLEVQKMELPTTEKQKYTEQKNEEESRRKEKLKPEAAPWMPRLSKDTSEEEPRQRLKDQGTEQPKPSPSHWPDSPALRQVDVNNYHKAEQTPFRQRQSREYTWTPTIYDQTVQKHTTYNPHRKDASEEEPRQRLTSTVEQPKSSPSYWPESPALRQVDVNNYHKAEHTPSRQRQSREYTWAPVIYDQTVQNHTTYNPNQCPSYSATSRDISVLSFETGSFASISHLLRSGFSSTDRVFLMTPWNNYVIFRGDYYNSKLYFLFTGCTCNIEKFRRLDLSGGTAGLRCFANLQNIIFYILDARDGVRRHKRKRCSLRVDDICRQYCGRSKLDPEKRRDDHQ